MTTCKDLYNNYILYTRSFTGLLFTVSALNVKNSQNAHLIQINDSDI